MVRRMDTFLGRQAGGLVVLGSVILLLNFFFFSANAPRLTVEATLDQTTSFPPLRVDINSASQAELTCIPGIGKALADRIVATRNELGAFRSLSQLDQIAGVGPRLLAELRVICALPDEAPSAGMESDRLAGQTTSSKVTETLND